MRVCVCACVCVCVCVCVCAVLQTKLSTHAAEVSKSVFEIVQGSMHVDCATHWAIGKGLVGPP